MKHISFCIPSSFVKRDKLPKKDFRRRSSVKAVGSCMPPLLEKLKKMYDKELMPCATFMANPAGYFDSLSRSQQHLLAYHIYMEVNRNPYRPAQETIGKKVGFCRETVNRGNKFLKEEGFIDSYAEYNKKTKRNTTCWYKITKAFKLDYIREALKNRLPLLKLLLFSSSLLSVPLSKANVTNIRKERDIYNLNLRNERITCAREAQKELDRKNELEFAIMELSKEDRDWFRQDNSANEAIKYKNPKGDSCDRDLQQQPHFNEEPRAIKTTTDVSSSTTQSLQKSKKVEVIPQKRIIEDDKKDRTQQFQSKAMQELVPQVVHKVARIIPLTTAGKIRLSKFPAEAIAYAIDKVKPGLKADQTFRDIAWQARAYCTRECLQINHSFEDLLADLYDLKDKDANVIESKDTRRPAAYKPFVPKVRTYKEEPVHLAWRKVDLDRQRKEQQGIMVFPNLFEGRFTNAIKEAIKDTDVSFEDMRTNLIAIADAEISGGSTYNLKERDEVHSQGQASPPKTTSLLFG